LDYTKKSYHFFWITFVVMHYDLPQDWQFLRALARRIFLEKKIKGNEDLDTCVWWLMSSFVNSFCSGIYIFYYKNKQKNVRARSPRLGYSWPSGSGQTGGTKSDPKKPGTSLA
jgi:hypothetical protein